MIDRYQTPEMKNLFTEIKRFEYMLVVEKAVAKVQAQHKLIPAAAARNIIKKSQIDLDRIYEIEAQTRHDVIAFVSQISESVGKDGKYIHFGLTSSDVLDTALSLQLNQAFEILFTEVKKLKTVLRKMARTHEATLCAGRTHGIYAEITTFGFKLMGFLSELVRCEKRMIQAQHQMQICKLSGAVGTSSSLSLEIEIAVARELKLQVEAFATQVIPRDRHAEAVMSLALTASCLERLALELRHLQRTEVNEVVEGFSPLQKGSSAMPHKKNPISAENITGLSRLIKGYAWTALENIPLWHERDISHSSNERVIFQDAFTALHYCLRRMIELLEKLQVNTQVMEKNTHKMGGVLYSSHLLNHLVGQHNLSREKAYQLIQDAAFGLKDGESMQDKIFKSKALKKYFKPQDIENIFSGIKHLNSIQQRIKKYEKNLA